MLKKGIIPLVFAVVFMAIAGCSGDSSSTDDAVTQPDNYLGTWRFEVDPTVDLSDPTLSEGERKKAFNAVPVASAFAGTRLPCTGATCFGTFYGINITTANQLWNGIDTMEADVTISYSNSANRIEETGIFVNAAEATGLVATITTQGIGSGTIGANLPGLKPGLIYANYDSINPGLPFFNPGFRNNYYTHIHGGCGALTRYWVMQEASSAPYSFWIDFFGTIAPNDPSTDPRFDNNFTTVRIEVSAFNPADMTYPSRSGGTIDSIASGGWFYVSIGYDGKFSTELAQQGGTTYDYYYNQSWNVRFDPGVVKGNSNDFADPPGHGNSALKFVTLAGTTLLSVHDPQGMNAANRIVDGWDMVALFNGGNVSLSNTIGWVSGITDPYSYSYSYNSISTSLSRVGLHENECAAGNGQLPRMCGVRGIIIDMVIIPLHAVGGAGSHTPLVADTGDRTRHFLANTNGTIDDFVNDPVFVDPFNPLWPTYEAMALLNPVVGGQYNLEYKYICVQ